MSVITSGCAGCYQSSVCYQWLCWLLPEACLLPVVVLVVTRGLLIISCCVGCYRGLFVTSGCVGCYQRPVCYQWLCWLLPEACLLPVVVLDFNRGLLITSGRVGMFLEVCWLPVDVLGCYQRSVLLATFGCVGMLPEVCCLPAIFLGCYYRGHLVTSGCVGCCHKFCIFISHFPW
jgi:hypothetical protein